MNDPYSRAVYFAKSYLELTKPNLDVPSDADIQEAARVAFAQTPEPAFSCDDIVDQLRTDFIHYQPPWEVLDEDPSSSKHEDWLSEVKDKSDYWQYWERFERHLYQENKLPHKVIGSLGDLTDDILCRIESPERPGPWDRRGLVVGEVQAGKTGNYTALICKAIDAGYKVIIVLAGLHKNLRSQTQIRLDSCIRGRTKTGVTGEELVGVGLMRGMGVDRVVHYLTDSSDAGDFKAGRVSGVQIGSDPVVLVIKKNKSILENVYFWIRKNDTSHSTFPFLLVDDEADHGSINTRAGKDEDDYSNDDDLTDEQIEILHEKNVTTTNRLIRQLLQLSNRTAYVGYTATPQANLFVDPDAVEGRMGADIFPESFIVNITSPTNYFGPERVFGFEEDVQGGMSGSPGLPIIRPVVDHDDDNFFPYRHRKTHIPQALPPSLKEALRSFILTIAGRMERGQVNEHNSMLIHVTRFVDVQGYVAELVQEEIASLRLRIRHGDGASKNQIMDELRALWMSDYVKTSERMAADHGGEPPVSWTEVKPFIKPAIEKIAEVREINGRAKDALDYVNHPDGLTVIAVGGDKLSRGLTLEGLSVSYYLRSSRMYDTLMQMGRWFGYRTKYEDFCRLYTTPDLVTCYRGIALADHELRREFSRMNEIPGATPADYGLKVRSGINGMLVTSLNKMRYGKDVEFSYSDSTAQLPYFSKDADIAEHNFNVTRTFLESLDAPDKESASPHYLWKKVPSAELIRFANDFKCCAKAFRVDSKRIAEYVETQNRHGNLMHWDVALVSITRGKLFDGGGILGQVGMSNRKDDKDYGDDKTFSLPKSQLLDPRFNSLGLDKAEMELAVALTKSHMKARNKTYSYPLADYVQRARGQRTPNPEGLLLLYVLQPEPAGVNHPVIGYGFIFPPLKDDKPVSYKVNIRFLNAMQLELGIDDL